MPQPLCGHCDKRDGVIRGLLQGRPCERLERPLCQRCWRLWCEWASAETRAKDDEWERQLGVFMNLPPLQAERLIRSDKQGRK